MIQHRLTQIAEEVRGQLNARTGVGVNLHRGVFFRFTNIDVSGISKEKWISDPIANQMNNNEIIDYLMYQLGEQNGTE